jgi:hypothetical protein
MTGGIEGIWRVVVTGGAAGVGDIDGRLLVEQPHAIVGSF